MQLDLSGLFPPVPTPFEKGHTAPHRLRENLEKWNATGLAGYLVLGSNGEAPYLGEAEKIEIIRTARAAIPHDRIMLVGTGLESTALTTVFTIRAADLGADAALVLTPAYYSEQMTSEALRRHYETIADAAPIPILIYNVPKFTRLNISLETVVALAKHENIVGIKDSAGNLGQLAALQESTPPHFHILIGNDSILLGGLAQGLKGAVLALANAAAQECVAILQAVEKGNLFATRAIMQRLAPVGRAVTSRWSIPGLKAALDLLGYFGGHPRPPLLPVASTVREELRAILRVAGLIS